MKGTCTFLLAVAVLGVSETWMALAQDRDFEKDAEYWKESAQAAIQNILANQLNTNVAKNVIMFLGDGMGVSTVTAARILKGQLEGLSGEEAALAWEDFPHVALSKTYNVDRQVADSAGSATAYLCGTKANFGTVGVDGSVRRGDCRAVGGDKHKVDSVARLADKNGKSVGVVTTTRITHASPAGAYANSPERGWENDSDMPDQAKRDGCKDIASQLIENGRNYKVLLGGGRRNFFDDAIDPEYPHESSVRGRRRDGRNLVVEWGWGKEDYNSSYVWNKEQFDKIDPLKTDYLLGLFEPSHMQYVTDTDRAGEPTLTEMTDKAIRMLQKDDNGFFLFVEGGRIDHGHHKGRATRALTETIEMERAVQRAKDLTSAEDTLIIVTADHSHTLTIGGYPMRGRPIIGMGQAYDGEDWAQDGLPFTTLIYANGPGYAIHGNGRRHDIRRVDVADKNYRQQATLPFPDESHAGEDVSIYARGPMAHLFHGVQDQSYIAHAIKYAACLGDSKDHCLQKEAAKKMEKQPDEQPQAEEKEDVEIEDETYDVDAQDVPEVDAQSSEHDVTHSTSRPATDKPALATTPSPTTTGVHKTTPYIFIPPSDEDARREAVFELISERVGGGWKKLVRCLPGTQLTKHMVQVVQKSYRGSKERTKKILSLWQQINSEDATIINLVTGLDRCGRRRLAKYIDIHFTTGIL
ncbi:PREDICTED: alkaline phosphatase-like [Branchiostoma belcheri]|uniref:Alkaline phosphatase n=1 Tax=Branchiostoma belcheri TaxID=7741 RepID=A0A6P4YCQ8_BRABE|nr:PREDICTED: alkaline phosphatase-like [Branchiostoma belcheri]